MPDVPIARIVSKIDARELIRRGKPIIKSSVKLFGERGVRQTGNSIVFNEANPRVTRFLRKWGAERIKADINRTTKERIRQVLAEAVQDGKSFDEMAKSIAHVFEVAKGSRAVTIARTEIARASNFASLEGFKQAGVEQKEWQATEDDAVRESHEDMNGQVVGVDEDFESGDGHTAPYPGEFGIPEEDINCRCGVLAVVNERGVRGWTWKALERERSPWQRRLRIAMAAGFEAQRRAVMAEFRSAA